MNFFHYIAISTTCLSIFYVVYLLIFRNDSNFKLLRLYLLTSLFLSQIMPFSSYRIEMEMFKNESQIPASAFFKNVNENQISKVLSINNLELSNIKTTADFNFFNSLTSIISKIYILIAALLAVRLIFQISVIVFRFYKSKRLKQGRFTIVYNKHFKNTFSFFNWIFVQPDFEQIEDKDKIVLHEKTHASQYHTIDLILIELLTSIMWFNPVIWLMRRSIQLVHEYLADEGALGTGIDRLKYQALLINQVTEEKLICVSSNFNSLIKKRMIMITKSKLNQKTKLKILALVPVSAVVFIAIACLNGLYPPKVKANPDFGKAFFRPKIVNSRQIPESIENDDTTKQIKIRKHKKENQSEEIKVIGNGDAGTVKDTSKLIYIVDGVQIKEVKSINPDQIESVNVLKDDNLIIVHTKNYVQSKPSFAIKNTKTANPNVIYFVDGVEQPIGMDLNSINKDSIQSISIIKSDQIKLFTNKKCDGLILITTKK